MHFDYIAYHPIHVVKPYIMDYTHHIQGGASPFLVLDMSQCSKNELLLVYMVFKMCR